MNRANPVDMRNALKAVHEFKKAGILFVPIPVLNREDRNNLIEKLESRLQRIETDCTQSEEMQQISDEIDEQDFQNSLLVEDEDCDMYS